jgi:hypothetical protein
VEFQVEKDTRAKRRYFPYRLRAGRGKKLAADLEHTHKVGNLFREFQRG